MKAFGNIHSLFVAIHIVKSCSYLEAVELRDCINVPSDTRLSVTEISDFIEKITFFQSSYPLRLYSSSSADQTIEARLNGRLQEKCLPVLLILTEKKACAVCGFTLVKGPQHEATVYLLRSLCSYVKTPH